MRDELTAIYLRGVQHGRQLEREGKEKRMTLDEYDLMKSRAEKAEATLLDLDVEIYMSYHVSELRVMREPMKASWKRGQAEMDRRKQNEH